MENKVNCNCDWKVAPFTIKISNSICKDVIDYIPACVICYQLKINNNIRSTVKNSSIDVNSADIQII